MDLSELDDGVEVEDQKSSKSDFLGGPNTGMKILPRVLAAIFLIVLLVWIFQAEGGLGTDEDTVFGVHALLMGLFVVVCVQESVLAYASPSFGMITRSRKILKYYHVICQLLGIALSIGGLVAIVYYKSLSDSPIVFPFYTMYSPHSWIGVAFLSLWVIQFGNGLYFHAFAANDLNAQHKRTATKWHRYLGKCIYVLGLATCAMGFQDMQSSDLASSSPPMNMDMDVQIMNMTGYYPDSNLAQYASACSLLLALMGMATFASFIR